MYFKILVKTEFQAAACSMTDLFLLVGTTQLADKEHLSVFEWKNGNKLVEVGKIDAIVLGRVEKAYGQHFDSGRIG